MTPRKDTLTGSLPFDGDAGRDGHDDLAEGRAGKKQSKKKQTEWDRRMEELGYRKESDDGKDPIDGRSIPFCP